MDVSYEQITDTTAGPNQNCSQTLATNLNCPFFLLLYHIEKLEDTGAWAKYFASWPSGPFNCPIGAVCPLAFILLIGCWDLVLDTKSSLARSRKGSCRAASFASLHMLGGDFGYVYWLSALGVPDMYMTNEVLTRNSANTKRNAMILVVSGTNVSLTSIYLNHSVPSSQYYIEIWHWETYAEFCGRVSPATMLGAGAFCFKPDGAWDFGFAAPSNSASWASNISALRLPDPGFPPLAAILVPFCNAGPLLRPLPWVCEENSMGLPAKPISNWVAFPAQVRSQGAWLRVWNLTRVGMKIWQTANLSQVQSLR